MSKRKFPLHKRISNKIIWNYRYLVRSKNHTIYHCCIQKSGSQWFKMVFNDELIWGNNKYLLYSPPENFITEDEKVLSRLSRLPKNLIIGPLYVRYEKFKEIDLSSNYKAFFIARDPRDLIISNYFSLKHSHSPYDPYILKMREKLNNMPQEEGISYIIESLTPGIKKTLEGWFSQKSEQVKLIKFEDFFGVNQLEQFAELINFCKIKLLPNDIEQLLEKYSFKNISGRQLGTEDIKNHYRKGTPGDWKNYFSTEHKAKFKALSRDLLVKCKYESDNNW